MDVVNYVRNQWDRVGAWLCIVAGAVALLVGYFGVSDTLVTGEQLPYVVSGGMFGLFLLGLGALLWVSADLRDEWRKLDAIDRHLVGGGELPPAEATPETASAEERETGARPRVQPREVSLS